MEELTFEQAFEQLEQAVQQLETGDLALADAIALFERGQKLAELCDRLLGDAELRVRQIVGDGMGGFEATPLDAWQVETAP